MQFKTIASVLTLTGLAIAAPSASRSIQSCITRNTYHGVGLLFGTSYGFAPGPAEMGILVQVNGGSGIVTGKVEIDARVAPNVDPNAVECRGYSDSDGVVPTGLPFTVQHPLEFNVNSTVSSVLCYVV